MNPQVTLEKYRSLVVINGDRIAHELSHALRQLPEDRQAGLMAQSGKAGSFWLFRTPKHPDFVLEVVYSPEHGDCITSVYRNASFNAAGGEVLRMREELIDAIANKVGLSHDLVGITDEGRGRQIGLNEMGTGQLVDMLAEQFKGKSILTMDNRAGNLSLMDKMLARFRRN